MGIDSCGGVTSFRATRVTAGLGAAGEVLELPSVPEAGKLAQEFGTAGGGRHSLAPLLVLLLLMDGDSLAAGGNSLALGDWLT